jgi:heme exporter protein C
LTQESLHKNLLNVLALAWIAASAASMWMIFFYAPVDATLGLSQKIFYIHLGSASAMAVCVLVAFVSSIRYLAKATPPADDTAAAAGELAVVFGAIVLVTGMIWAKAAWGTWLPLGEIKLVLFLVLWIIFVVYLILRGSIESPQKKAAGSAVFAIMGFVVMPFVVMATRWFNFGFQLHPNVIKAHDAGMPAQMLATLLVSIASWLLIAVLLLYMVTKFREIERVMGLARRDNVS